MSNAIYCHVSGVPWQIITGSGLDDSIYWHTFTQFRTAGNYSAVAILHAFQLTVAHARGFSVFISCTLTKDLSQSHCNFKSHMKFSCHRLIPSLPFLQQPIPRLLSTTVVYCAVCRCIPILLTLDASVRVEAYVTTDGQSASLSWYIAPIRVLRPDFFSRSEYGIRLTVAFFILWDALSDERSGLSFVYAAGPCKRSLSRS
jgi:hypothetical protein